MEGMRHCSLNSCIVYIRMLCLDEKVIQLVLVYILIQYYFSSCGFESEV